jgi:hypothetical protein
VTPVQKSARFRTHPESCSETAGWGGNLYARDEWNIVKKLFKEIILIKNRLILKDTDKYLSEEWRHMEKRRELRKQL